MALKAVDALRGWARRNPRASQQESLLVIHGLLETQADMAPFFRLANELALAVDSNKPHQELFRACAGFESVLRDGAQEIAKMLRRALRSGGRKTILTYSYSSTVLRALVHSKARIQRIYCSEASPEMEGRELASTLAAAGLRVTLTTDLSLPSFVHGADDEHPRPDAVVVGADQVRPRRFVNRYGTEILVEETRRARIPFWVLTDTSKFVPEIEWRRELTSMETSSRLWPGAPKRVEPWLRLLGEAPLAANVRILTERGWMTPEQARRAIQQIRISPTLEALLETRD
ncbi:MAG TPA: hypothetical protein VJN21_12155 [Candidatus Acidoferrales bacterium]|nr:hypothetical protein [Candidatus Acidoferrales bacterium]